MASILYENVENWHRSGESRDLLSSDETEPFSFKGDVKDHDDLYEEVSSKQHSLKEIADENATAKENGHVYDRVNGNGVHEKHSEDACNEYEEDKEDEEEEKDNGVDDQDNGEENDSDRAETTDEEPTPQVPYYGRTLVAPEYMNFQLPEETSQREQETAEDDGNNGTGVADDSNDLVPSKNIQVEDNHEEDVRAEGSFDPNVQKEVLEEDDFTLSEEETDEEDDDGVGEDETPVKDVCQVKEKDEKEEEEEREEEDRVEDEGEGDEEGEEEVQEDSTEEESKLNSEIDHEGSPQLAQAEDEDEEHSEDDGLEEEKENDGDKLEASLLKKEAEGEETESKEEDTHHENQKETCPQLAEADDEDDDNGEAIDNEEVETLIEPGLKHSDSLKVHVPSPTPEIGEVASAAESFDDGEGVTVEDAEGDKVDQEQSLNETYHDEEDENRRTTFNGPVEEYDGQQNKDVETKEEMVQGNEDCESEDTKEDSGDETADIICEPDQDEVQEEHAGDQEKPEDDLDLETIPEGEDAESDRDDQEEDFSVHTSLQGRHDESDLTGRVKELGRMFEGGGPVFPKTEKNDTDAVDGSPVSVRKYKAIFEKDRLSTARAREPGHREEITSPPRGIVKNLRGMFENPQGFEARTG